jgi:hypothetical protein
MPTIYAGREDEFDLGDGHSFRWLSDNDGVFGLIEHHPKPSPDAPGEYCGGYIAWRQSEGSRVPPRHQLVAGGSDDPEHLTVAPSLACRQCSSHGWIRDGRWVEA